MQTRLARIGRAFVSVFPVIAALTLMSCTIGSLRISIPGQATQQPPIALQWCAQARDVLCVLSFGLEPPDQMVIVLMAAPGLPAELKAHADWNGETGTYPCEPTNADATLQACTGSLMPLGSSVHIDVTAVDAKAVIASGDFVLNGLALPTVPSGADLPLTDAVTITPRPTRTLSGGTPPSGADLPPTDAVTITPQPTRTPSGGTPYPNPTPQQ